MGPALLVHLPTAGSVEPADPLVQLVWSDREGLAEQVVHRLRSHATLGGQPFAVVDADDCGVTVLVGGEVAVRVELPAGTEQVVGRAPGEPVEMRFDGLVYSVTVGVPGPEPCVAGPPALLSVGSATVTPPAPTRPPNRRSAPVPPAAVVEQEVRAIAPDAREMAPPPGVPALGGGFLGMLPVAAPSPRPPRTPRTPRAPRAPQADEPGPPAQHAEPDRPPVTRAFGLLEPLGGGDGVPTDVSLLPPAPGPPPGPLVRPPSPLLSAEPEVPASPAAAQPGVPGAPDDHTTVIGRLPADLAPGGDATVVRPVFAGVDLGSLLPSAPAPVAQQGPVVRARRCSCATLNAPGREQCRSCGALLLQDRPLVTGPRPRLGTLEFDDGMIEPVDGPLVIGRRPPASRTVAGEVARTVEVDDPEHVVSGFHLEVRIDDWVVSVVDYGSTNGTWITPPRGPAVRLRASEPTPLVHGCEVSLGGGRSFGYTET